MFVHSNKLDTSKYAILDYETVHWPLNLDKNSKSFNLSEIDIRQIEYLLDKEVNRINKANKKKMIKKPSKFYKQLIAVINSKGEKEVWVNCLCDLVNASNWKKEPVVVLDGSPCYFNFKVNLTTNVIYDFILNGVA